MNIIIITIVIIHTIFQHILNSAWRKAYKTKGKADDSLVIAAFVIESFVVIEVLMSLL